MDLWRQRFYTSHLRMVGTVTQLVKKKKLCKGGCEVSVLEVPRIDRKGEDNGKIS